MTPPVDPSQSQPSSSRSLGLRAVLFGIAVVLLYLFLFGPLLALMQAQPLRFQATQAQTIRTHLLQKLDLLEQAKRSPLLAYRAKQSQQALLRLWLSPSRLQRAWRGFLRQGTLSTWKAHEKTWRNLIHDVQKRLPNESFRHLHAFLDLQLGAWKPLVREASRYAKETPAQQREALYWIWVGHAAFFAGLSEAAQTAYQKALVAAEKHPSWAQQSRHNWRFPGELLAARYHLALLFLAQGKPQQALPFFEKNLQHWEKTYKSPHRSPLWYHSILWLAITQYQAQHTQRAHKSLQKALRFYGDSALAKLLLAQFSTPKQARPHLDVLVQANPHFRYAYPDIQITARLLRGLHIDQETEKKAVLPSSLPFKKHGTNTSKPTTATTTATTTPITCTPLPKAAQEDLDHAFTLFQRPKKPQTLADLYQIGDYSYSFAPIPMSLLKRWLQRLCPHTPRYRPQRAKLKLLLVMQLARQGHHKAALRILNQSDIAQYHPEDQRALRWALQDDLRLPIPQRPISSPSLLHIAPWWHSLGPKGCLSRSLNNTPKARHACKKILPYLFAHPTPLKLFASPLISDHPEQFTLLTLQRKEILRQRWQGALRKAPLHLHTTPSLRAIQQLYRAAPHAAYLLDQTAYSFAWGTLAYTFRRQP